MSEATVTRLARRQPSWSSAAPAARRSSSAACCSCSRLNASRRPERSRNRPTDFHISSRMSASFISSVAQFGAGIAVSDEIQPAATLRHEARRPSRGPRAHRTPGLRAANCWRGDSRRARACMPPRPRRTAPAPTCGRRDRSRRLPSCSARRARPEEGRARDRTPPSDTSRRSSETAGALRRRRDAGGSGKSDLPIRRDSSTMLRETTSRGARSAAG